MVDHVQILIVLNQCETPGQVNHADEGVFLDNFSEVCVLRISAVWSQQKLCNPPWCVRLVARRLSSAMDARWQVDSLMSCNRMAVAGSLDSVLNGSVTGIIESNVRSCREVRTLC